MRMNKNYIAGFMVFLLIYSCAVLFSLHTSPMLKQAVAPSNGGSPHPTAKTSTSFVILLSAEVVIVSIVVILHMRYGLFAWLFRSVKGFPFASIISFFILFSLLPFLMPLFSALGEWSVLAVLGYLIAIGAIAFRYLRHPSAQTVNILAFLSCMIFPLYLGGVLLPLYAFILLGIFALYDFVAVFGTKHMIYMAKRLIEHNIPEVFTFSISGGRPLILGAGDALLPASVISAFGFAGNSLIAGILASGAALGLAANLVVLQKLRRPLPALPLIFLSMVGVFALCSIVFGYTL